MGKKSDNSFTSLTYKKGTANKTFMRLSLAHNKYILNVSAVFISITVSISLHYLYKYYLSKCLSLYVQRKTLDHTLRVNFTNGLVSAGMQKVKVFLSNTNFFKLRGEIADRYRSISKDKKTVTFRHLISKEIYIYNIKQISYFPLQLKESFETLIALVGK